MFVELFGSVYNSHYWLNVMWLLIQNSKLQFVCAENSDTKSVNLQEHFIIIIYLKIEEFCLLVYMYAFIGHTLFCY